MAKKNCDIDGGWAWFVAFGVFLSFLLLGGFSRSFGILYAAFLDMFGESAFATSMIPAVRTACPIVIGPLSTTLSERYTERKVVIAGSLLIAAGFVLSFFAASLNYLIVSLGLIPGIGMALLISPSNVSMGKYFRRLRSRVYSLTSCGVCLGLVTVPLLLTYLIDTFSIRGTLLIYGGICLNLVITGQVQCPIQVAEDYEENKDQEMQEIPARSDENKEGDLNLTENTMDEFTGLIANEDVPHGIKQYGDSLNKVSNTSLSKTVQGCAYMSEIEDTTTPIEVNSSPSPVSKIGRESSRVTKGDSDGDQKSNIASYPQTLRISNIIVTLKIFIKDLFDMTLMKNYVYLIFLCSGSLSDIMYANQSIYLVPLIESRDISRKKAAIILSIMGGCDVIGRLVSGFLADKRPLLPQHVMCVNGIVAGILCCFFPLAQTFGHFTAISVVFALVSSAPTLLIMPALAESIGVASLARGLGLGMFFRGICAAISQPLFGLLKDVTGSFDVIFPVIGCIQIVGGAVLLLEPVAKKLMHRRSAKEIKAQNQVT